MLKEAKRRRLISYNSGEDVKKDLNYFLIEKREPYPWKYAAYHCSTAANIYSPVHSRERIFSWWACIEVMTTVLTISGTVQPLLKSFTGYLRP